MKNRQRTLTIVLAAVYGAVLVWVVLFKALPLSQIPDLDRQRAVNLIPFYYDTETRGHLSEVLWNAVLFMPLGVYLKMLGKSVGSAVLFGAACSLLLETAQYVFGIGASDVTDLLMNTLGAAVGALLCPGLERLFRDREKLHGAMNAVALAGTILVLALAALLLSAN